MLVTKNALGNLIRRYSAVLAKCRLLNTFGSLVVAGMMVLGSVGGALAAETININTFRDKITGVGISGNWNATNASKSAGQLTDGGSDSTTITLNATGSPSYDFITVGGGNQIIKWGTNLENSGTVNFSSVLNVANVTTGSLTIQNGGTITGNQVTTTTYTQTGGNLGTVNAGVKIIAGMYT